jgi:hypothetical protein
MRSLVAILGIELCAIEVCRALARDSQQARPWLDELTRQRRRTARLLEAWMQGDGREAPPLTGWMVVAQHLAKPSTPALTLDDLHELDELAGLVLSRHHHLDTPTCNFIEHVVIPERQTAVELSDWIRRSAHTHRRRRGPAS